MNENWRAKAKCLGKDVNMFYPDFNAKGSLKRANATKLICVDCPVKTECLEYAIKNNEEFGIWGGMLANERAKIRSARRKSKDLSIPTKKPEREMSE